jgi:hypothetical protein
MMPFNPFVLGTKGAINHGHCYVEKHSIVHATAIYTYVAEVNVYKPTFPVTSCILHFLHDGRDFTATERWSPRPHSLSRVQPWDAKMLESKKKLN